MPNMTNTDYSNNRQQLADEVRRLLYEGMKKAEQEKNWEVFNRYASAYRQMVG
jgi:hypothetical protein